MMMYILRTAKAMAVLRYDLCSKNPWCANGIDHSDNLWKIYTKQYVFHKYLFGNIENVVSIFATCPHILFYSIARTKVEQHWSNKEEAMWGEETDFSAVLQNLCRKIIWQTEEFQVMSTYTFLTFPILN